MPPLKQIQCLTWFQTLSRLVFEVSKKRDSHDYLSAAQKRKPYVSWIKWKPIWFLSFCHKSWWNIVFFVQTRTRVIEARVSVKQQSPGHVQKSQWKFLVQMVAFWERTTVRVLVWIRSKCRCQHQGIAINGTPGSESIHSYVSRNTGWLIFEPVSSRHSATKFTSWCASWRTSHLSFDVITPTIRFFVRARSIAGVFQIYHWCFLKHSLLDRAGKTDIAHSSTLEMQNTWVTYRTRVSDCDCWKTGQTRQ